MTETTPAPAPPGGDDGAVAALTRHEDGTVTLSWPFGRPRVTPCTPEALEGMVDQHNALIAARDAALAEAARARAEALTSAADAWQQGQWADAPRRSDRVQERIANAQHVTDWLRARAVALSDAGTDETGTPPVSDNAETREALEYAIEEAVYDPWEVPCPSCGAVVRSACSDHRPHQSRIVRAVLAALPPVAGPEVRPDETLRRIADDADEYADGWGLRNLTAADQFTALAAIARAALAAPAPAPGDEGLGVELGRLLSALHATYTAEGVLLYITRLANKAEGLAGGPALASPAPAATEVGEGER